MNRRELLAMLAAGTLLPATALGFGESTRFDVAELDLGRDQILRTGFLDSMGARDICGPRNPGCPMGSKYPNPESSKIKWPRRNMG